MGLFRKKVALRDQLARLAELGITPNAETEESDLLMFHGREELEAKPFEPLAETMGMAIEREPWTPISDRLWMCDLERVEDHGAYRDVLVRLERMTGSALALSRIEDHVDLEGGVAWVRFDHGGKEVRWNFRVDDDWLDPRVLVEYGALLASSGSPLRLYQAIRAEEYGQVAFLGAFAPEQQKKFTKLTGIRMGLVS